MTRSKLNGWKTACLLLPVVVAGCATTLSVERLNEEVAWEAVDALSERGSKTVAVYYFTLSGRKTALSDTLIDGITAQLAAAVSEEKLQVKVLNRQQLDRVLQELALQASDLSAQAVARVGTQLGADYLLTGTITPSYDVYVLNGQLIEVGTGVVLTGFTYEFWADPALVK